MWSLLSSLCGRIYKKYFILKKMWSENYGPHFPRYIGSHNNCVPYSKGLPFHLILIYFKIKTLPKSIIIPQGTLTSQTCSVMFYIRPYIRIIFISVE